MSNVQKGYQGAFYLGSTEVCYIGSWELSRNLAANETTSFCDNGDATFEPGGRSWTASVSGVLDEDEASQRTIMDQFEDGTRAKLAVKFYTDDGPGGSSTVWYGSAIATSSSISNAVADNVQISFEFQGSGPIYYTSA